jgi:ubiquitin-protein ligase
MSTSSTFQRLSRDYSSFKKEEGSDEFCSIHQCESNYLHFHVNFFHEDFGNIHFMLKFNGDYPHSPPMILLYGSFQHDNIFYNDYYGSTEPGFPYICLDMLKPRNGSMANYSGWSSAYSLSSIVMQFYSFLFDEKIEQDYGGYSRNHITSERIQLYKNSVRNLVINIEGNQHTFLNPFPPRPVTQLSEQDFPSLGLSLLKLDEKKPSVTDKGNLIINDDVIRIILKFLPIASYKDAKRVSKRWQFFLNQYDFVNSIICFYSKSTLNEAVIGIGINVGYHHGGGIKFISTEGDYLSYDAFLSGVKFSAWNKPITHFIPLVINRSNFEKGLPIFLDTLRSIFNKSNIGSQEILEFFSSFMNNIVVELFKVSQSGSVARHSSEKALTCYTCIHHLLLKVLSLYPKMINLVDEKIKSFMSDPDKRNKKHVPDIGKFLVYLAIHPNFTWNNIWADYLKETFIRNVRWMVTGRDSCPELLNLDLDTTNRLRYTFDHPNSKTSRALIMFQVYFINNVASPKGSTHSDILEKYKRTYGRPTENELENLQLYCKKINQVYEWGQFFELLNIPKPDLNQLNQILVRSVEKSAELGYHRGRGRGRGRGGYQRGRGRGGYQRGRGRGGYQRGRGRGGYQRGRGRGGY